jgi:hypothetical protein
MGAPIAEILLPYGGRVHCAPSGTAPGRESGETDTSLDAEAMTRAYG